jgi:hypothetical protein
VSRSEVSLAPVTVLRVERGWDPWATLRGSAGILFDLVDLEPGEGDAFYWPLTSGEAVIGVGRHLDEVGRRAALGHELIHHERGGGRACAGMPRTWEAVVVRDENAVEAELARRMVPVAHLAALLEACEDMGHAPDLWEVAEEFGVPESVAARAIGLLTLENYGERWAG